MLSTVINSHIADEHQILMSRRSRSSDCRGCRTGRRKTAMLEAEAVSEIPVWEAALSVATVQRPRLLSSICFFLFLFFPGPQLADSSIFHLYRRHKNLFNVSLNNSTLESEKLSEEIHSVDPRPVCDMSPPISLSSSLHTFYILATLPFYSLEMLCIGVDRPLPIPSTMLLLDFHSRNSFRV